MGVALSLICATRDRVSEVSRLLKSLDAQTRKDFEIIVVDQNEDNRLKEALALYAGLSIKHIRLEATGNTRARNVGLQHAAGNWVGFPDDDCWMSPNFIASLMAASEQPEREGLFINWSDPESGKVMFNFSSSVLALEDVLVLGSAICMYFKKEVLLELKGFDERFGLGKGTQIKAGEEQELLFRMVITHQRIIKVPDLYIHHPIVPRPWNDMLVQRIIGQGAADVYFRRKYFGLFRALRTILFWTGGLLYNLIRFRSEGTKWYYYKLVGGLWISPGLK